MTPATKIGLALAAALAVGGGGTGMAAGGSGGPFAFGGAWLGMTLQEWRAMAAPSGVGQTTRKACSTDYRADEVGRDPFDATAAPSGVIACAYVSRFGDRDDIHTVDLGRNFQVSALEFAFVHGRLAQISFDAPVDALNDLEGRLDRRYGRPFATSWTNVHVHGGSIRELRLRWRSHAGDVILSSPGPGPTRLSVRYFDRRLPAGLFA